MLEEESSYQYAKLNLDLGHFDEAISAIQDYKSKYPGSQRVENIDEILTALENNEADFAAAGLTHTTQRSNGFLFSIDYQKVQQQVVCRRGGPRPGGLPAGVSGAIHVRAGRQVFDVALYDRPQRGQEREANESSPT